MATRKPIIYINGYPSELDIASDRLNTPWIYRAGSAPTAQTADMWYDTTNSLLKMWNGSAWESVGGSKVYIQTSAPSSGMNEGDWWHNTTDSSTKIYLAGSINAWTAVGGSGGEHLVVELMSRSLKINIQLQLLTRLVMVMVTRMLYQLDQ